MITKNGVCPYLRETEPEIIGTSKVSTDLKVTLVKDVQLKLNAQRGDILAFYEDNGQVIIKIVKL